MHGLFMYHPHLRHAIARAFACRTVARTLRWGNPLFKHQHMIKQMRTRNNQGSRNDLSINSDSIWPQLLLEYDTEVPHDSRFSRRGFQERIMGNMLDMSIHEYAEAGDYEGIKEYVRQGGNVMKRDFFHNTALHRSASMGFTTITRFLLDEGAEVDATAKDGWTPLHLACRWGRVGAIRELVAAGADVEKKTGDGRAPGELLKPEMTDIERNEVVKLLGCRPRRGRPASPGEVEDE